MKTKKIGLLVLVAGFAGVATGWGANNYLNGNWDVPANWSLGTISSGDTICIYGNETGFLNNAGASHSYTPTVNGLLIATNGATGGGIVNLQAGTVSVAGLIDVGRAASSNGALNIWGGVLNAGGSVSVGGAGSSTGVLNITAGNLNLTHASTGAVNIGNAAGANGTIMITGGNFNKTGTGSVNVGNNSDVFGNLTVAGGNFYTGGSVHIGNATDATGVMNVWSGNVVIAGGLNIGGRLTGATTKGDFVMTGGMVDVTGNLYAGASANNQLTSGNMTVTGGVMTVASGGQFILGASNVAGAGNANLTVGSGGKLVVKGSSAAQFRQTGSIKFQIDKDPVADLNGDFVLFDLSENTAAAAVAASFKLSLDMTNCNLNLYQGDPDLVLQLIKFNSTTTDTTKGNFSTLVSDIENPWAGTMYDVVRFEYDAGYNAIVAVIRGLAVPEPSTYALLAGLGVLAGVMVWRRRR